ncbi:MAG: PKD domain-containing protein, partial [Bacteroidota bacterium]|nr:PKD domain-containing protein [Bacteroidota bacterium]
MNKIGLFICLFGLSQAVKSQTADFMYATSNGLFCSPSTIQFTQTSTGSPIGFVRLFGNNTGSNSPNPTVTYTNPGSYTVKLIVIYQQTTAVVTKTVVVNPAITASIGYDRNYICTPGVINFTGATNGNISTYSWDFGDGSGTINTSSPAIAHSFAAKGAYNVNLLATDVSGCFNSAKTVINVQDIPISGTASPTSGCVPANVSFTANATIPAGSSVTGYSWDFGDGSPVVSTSAKNINHIYSAAGSYSPMVTVTTSEGCSNNYNFSGLDFGTPPYNQISYPVKNVICGSDTAAFVSKATNANRYYYNFNDGSSIYVTDTLAYHKFATLGLKYIYTLPLYNGCYSNPITIQLDVVGVIATYTYSNTCADKKTFSFNNTSQGNLSTVSWDFGDGSPIVNTVNAIHTFPSSGSFITRLTVTDNVTGCSDTYSQTIYTANPALLNSDTSICRNDSTTFTVVNNANNPADTYTWHVVGQQAGPFPDSVFTIKATNFGNFQNYVVINSGAQYCQDTIALSNTILVKGPDLNFTAPSSLCLTNLYSVNNASKPYVPADSVVLWFWNFGANNTNDTVYQPQPYLYANPGTYNVKLIGMDINGCRDSLVKPITVNPLPFLYVIPATDTLCSGMTDSLFAFHSDSITWSPSNSLTCATCDTALTHATADTKYFITATSKFGCTVTDSAFVKVYPPFTAVPSASDLYICLNDSVQLNVDPPGKKITWAPVISLSSATAYGPIASPTQTTTYIATLTDSVGCFTSSADIKVHIKNLPKVDAGPDKTYPFNSNFSINPLYSNNISSYSWSPSNLVGCNTCPNINGVATNTNTFVIAVTSDSGCLARDSITIFIECKDANLLLPNAFTPNNDNINDYFY